MKAIITALIISAGCGVGAYFGASNNELERAFFIFSGTFYGFLIRHFVFTSLDND